MADLALWHGVILRQLADVDALGIAAHQVQDALADEPVVEHDIGALHEPERLKGQKVGIARAGADEIHFPLLAMLGASGGGLKLSVEFHNRFGFVAGEHQIDDRPL